MFASGASTVKLWDSTSYNECFSTTINNGSVVPNGLTFNNDGNSLASLSDGSPDISLYTVSGNSAVHHKTVRPMDNPKCILFPRQSSKLLGVGGRNTVLVWDVVANCQSKYYGLKENGVTSMRFSYRDTHICCGTKQGNLYLLSVSNNLISGPISLNANKSKINCIQYSKFTRSLIATGSDSGNVSFFDTNTKKIIQSNNQHVGPVSDIAFSPINSLLFISVGYDKKIIFQNVNAKEPIQSTKCDTPLTSCCFLPGGHRLVFGTITGQILFYDLRMLVSPTKTVKCDSSSINSIVLQAADKNSGQKSTAKANSVSNPNSVKKEVKISSNQTKVSPPKSKKIEMKLEIIPPKSSPNEIPTPSGEASPQILSPIRTLQSEHLSPMLTHVDSNTKNRLTSLNLSNEKSKSLDIYDDVLSPVRNINIQDKSNEILTPSPGHITPKIRSKRTEFLTPANPDFTENSPNDENILSPINDQDNVKMASLDENMENKENLSSSQQNKSPSKFAFDNANRSPLGVKNSPDLSNSQQKPRNVRFAPEICVKDISDSSDDSRSTISNESKTTIPNESRTSISNESDQKLSFETRLTNLEHSFKNIESLLVEMNQNLKQNQPKNINESDILEKTTGQSTEIELIRNCIKDIMFEYRQENHKRFINLHRIILNLFYDHKLEMEELIKKHSLNDELFRKCEELHDENRCLKNLY